MEKAVIKMGMELLPRSDVARSARGRFRSQTFRDRRKALARKAKHKGLDWRAPFFFCPDPCAVHPTASKLRVSAMVGRKPSKGNRHRRRRVIMVVYASAHGLPRRAKVRRHPMRAGAPSHA